MKIENNSRRTIRGRPLRDSTGTRSPIPDDFTSELQNASQKQTETELDQMFAKVFLNGEQLVVAQSMDAVDRYRKSVKRLVEHIVKYSLNVSNTTVSDRSGRNKLYSLVEEIDRSLLEILMATLQKQKEPLQILQIVGEIKGLLISLRT